MLDSSSPSPEHFPNRRGTPRQGDHFRFPIRHRLKLTELLALEIDTIARENRGDLLLCLQLIKQQFSAGAAGNSVPHYRGERRAQAELVLQQLRHATEYVLQREERCLSTSFFDRLLRIEGRAEKLAQIALTLADAFRELQDPRSELSSLQLAVPLSPYCDRALLLHIYLCYASTLYNYPEPKLNAQASAVAEEAFGLLRWHDSSYINDSFRLVPHVVKHHLSLDESVAAVRCISHLHTVASIANLRGHVAPSAKLSLLLAALEVCAWQTSRNFHPIFGTFETLVHAIVKLGRRYGELASLDQQLTDVAELSLPLNEASREAGRTALGLILERQEGLTLRAPHTKQARQTVIHALSLLEESWFKSGQPEQALKAMEQRRKYEQLATDSSKETTQND